MKCPECDGKGFVYNALGNFNEDCGHCHGIGQIQDRFNAVDVLEVMEKIKKPQTNEEWSCGLSTEEKAKVFGHMLFEAWKDGLAEEMHDKEFYEDLVDFWLKQPHSEE